MNNDRRKRINAVMDSLNEAMEEIDKLHTEVVEALDKLNEKVEEVKDAVTAQIEELRDEEQETFDNMPEGLQNGEKGQMAEQAVSNLESAIGELESLEAISEPDLPSLADAIDYLSQAAE